MASDSDPRPDPAALLAEAGFLRRLATELVRLPHDADDLVQETWVRALEHGPQRSTSLRGWLSVVARNLAFNSSRSARRRDEHEQRAARPEALEAGDISLERLEQQRKLFELVLSLPDEQRTVLYLRYYEGLTPTEIAQRLRAPLKTVKTRQTRALAALRERLDARDGGDGTAWRLALLPLAPTPVPGSILPTFLGGILMKKSLAVAACVLLALVAWFGYRRVAVANLERSGSVDNIDMPQVAPPPPATALAPELVAQREELAQLSSTASNSPRSGRAVITLLWSDGTPAIGIGATMNLARSRGTPEQRERATSDSKGELRFEELELGANRISIDLRGSFELEVPADDTLRTTVTLEAGENVHGRVLDDTGAPLAAADIVFEGGDGWTPRVEVVASTDAAGEFTLRDVSADEELGARARGFLPSSHLSVNDLEARSRERFVEFRLERGQFRLAGRVLAPDGTPVAGARVLAGPRNGHIVPGPRGGNATAPQPRATTSAADGSFELPDALPAGTQPLHCFARGFAAWNGSVGPADASSPFVLQLQPAARIEGRVVDSEGRPVAAAEVRQSVEHLGGWFHSDAFPPPMDRTDTAGWFVLDWVGPGPREVNAWNPAAPKLGRARATVQCIAGETVRCELRLDRGLMIEGRVSDESGRPLVGWYVGSQPSSLMNQWYPRSTTTDSEGRFQLVNLGPGAHEISVRTPDLSAPRLTLPEVLPGTTGLELVVPDAHEEQVELVGRIASNTASQLVGLEVTLWRTGQNEGHFLELNASTGEFRGKAFPGHYRLDITRNGANAASVPPFELPPGQRTDLGFIELAPTGSVEIVATDLSTEVLRNLHIRLTRPDHREIALAWTDGVARATDVIAGRWQIAQWDKELEISPDEIEVEPGTVTRVQVELRPKRR